MINSIAQFAQLEPGVLAVCAALVLVAGMVRGFSGFGLSAVTMTGLVTLVPPLELVPLCFFLELSAGIVLFRGGLKTADKTLVIRLVAGSIVGIPLGLGLALTIPPQIARIVILVLVLVLAAALLFRFAPAALKSRAGIFCAGMASGMATGLAFLGGLVVSLLVLASGRAPAQMRGSMVLFLFCNLFVAASSLVLFGVVDQRSIQRAVVFVPIALVGVGVGSALFRPSLAAFYRQFCLLLLAGLAAIGLLRLF